MTYTMHYDSPLGKILLAADEEGLTGVWFEAQKYFAAKLPPEHEEGTTPVLGDACRWLDVYFSGRELSPNRAYRALATPRMVAFRPGQSPPEVRIPTRFFISNNPRFFRSPSEGAGE